MIPPLDPNTLTGLSDAEAELRLKQEGYNALPDRKRGNFFTIALEVLSEPIFLLLVACGAIYWVLGDRQEALILLGFIFFIMGITLYQDNKTEGALEALRDLSSPRASVIREGQKKRIAGREVVRGDILILSEGDRVPADAVLLTATNLTADESLLTGESIPVRKVTGERQTPLGHPGGDDLPFVYSGTLIVQGQGIAEVKAIGNQTELGKIGKALQTVVTEDTPLQRETRALVNQLIWIAIAICVAVIVIYGLTRGNWLNGFLAGLALAMAILPNEFPVVLTIFLALGAWRISQNRVLRAGCQQ
jgi:Ca2+-transporting ATPase